MEKKCLWQSPFYQLHWKIFTIKVYLLAAVYYYLLWLDPFLQHAHLWMIPSASEQARRLNLEVTNLFLMSINNAEAVLLHNFLILFLQGLLDYGMVNCFKV